MGDGCHDNPFQANAVLISLCYRKIRPTQLFDVLTNTANTIAIVMLVASATLFTAYSLLSILHNG
ncbi:hypothetical protein C8E00_10233 [Chromohalobacter marismortui]|uniref:Uncharacterized protein n=1 Tax=Chromohalobacter marismortui TaxID=42055 RepID=A0A4V3F409_9GAMM|nr:MULTISPECIES: hypothetical protein [Chromohalobacter]MCI0592369.1 hypothetical protein [Chromohalobacter sp.]TDU23546.1 hypothetical protein C8E00_10233 [Chromohalobacter marismortui]